MQVSTPETTAFDLISYVKASGHLNHIATTLAELQETLDEKRLTKLVNTEVVALPDMQRLGYLLEFVGAKPEIISILKNWVKTKNPRAVALRSDKDFQKSDELRKKINSLGYEIKDANQGQKVSRI